jgi:hypothetical protein
MERQHQIQNLGLHFLLLDASCITTDRIHHRIQPSKLRRNSIDKLAHSQFVRNIDKMALK